VTEKGKTGSRQDFDTVRAWGAIVLRPYTRRGERMIAIDVTTTAAVVEGSE
jgi:hypothetical protein